MRSRLTWILVSSLLGCDSSSTGSGGSGGGGGSDQGTGGATTTRIRFFVDERPHDTTDQESETAEAKWGDPVRIVVEGLTPDTDVRLEFSLGSQAEFHVEDAGTIDLSLATPTNGTWTVADLDGPFWSAPPSTMPLFDYDVRVVNVADEAELATASFRRTPVGEGLETTEVVDGTSVGVIVHPKGDPSIRRPAILAFGGSEGGSFAGVFEAYYWAQFGYVSFGVAYFGEPGLPGELERVPLEIMKDNLALLAARPDVDPSRIAVIGGSRGGELALMLGAYYPELVGAVVAQVPSGYTWSGGTLVTPAWTREGVDVPFIPSSGALGDTYVVEGETHLVSSPSYIADIAAATPAERSAARTPVENIRGPVLLLAGEDDALWPSCVLAEVAWKTLETSGHVATHGDETYCFEGAGHGFTFPPGSPTTENPSNYYPEYDLWADLGGTRLGTARAERAANTKTRAFLERALAP